MKALIKRLREGVADTGHLIKSAASVNATMYEAADALEQQAKQIEELAAALAEKDEALREVQGLIEESAGVYGLHLNGDLSPWDELTRGGLYERIGLLDSGIALQPHASLVAKIKADAVREAVRKLATEPYGNIKHTTLLNYADHIERGEG